MDEIAKVINDLSRKWNQEYTFKPTQSDEAYWKDWVSEKPNQVEELKILIRLQKMQMAMINHLRVELERIEKSHSTQYQVTKNFEDFDAKKVKK